MLNVIKKILLLGPIWFLQRLLQAFFSPTSAIGQKAKLFFYYLFHPLIFLNNFFLRYFSLNFSRDHTLNVVYDLNFNPISFDFSFFMATAEAYAKMHKKDHIHLWIIRPNREKVLLSKIKNLEYESIVNIDSQEWRINNMIIPIVHICPSVAQYSVVQDAADIQKQFLNNTMFPEGYGPMSKPCISYDYSFSMLAQYNFWGFKSSNQAKIFIQNWLDSANISSKIISITIRDYDFDPLRNSSFQTWIEFANYLENQGYKVIFIPDIENCWDSKYKDIKQTYFSEICWNLELRTAFYELCELNYFYSSGLASLAMLNKNTRAISMTPLIEDSRESTSEIIKSYHPDMSDNPFKYNKAYQWTLFKTDTYENLIEDFDRYKKLHLDT